MYSKLIERKPLDEMSQLFQRPAIKVIRQTQNYGEAKSRANALIYTNNDFVLFLDSFVECLPGYLIQMVNLLQESLKHTLVLFRSLFGFNGIKLMHDITFIIQEIVIKRLAKDNSNQIIAPVVKRIDPENFGISNIDQLENTERFIFRVSHFRSIQGYSRSEHKTL